jgi:uncharacterized membrane protein YcaP (DUF421 family)
MDSKILHDMFSLGLPWIEKILRPLFVYAFLIIGLRLAGKRELAQLNPFDLVVLLTLSNTVQNAIIGDDSADGRTARRGDAAPVNYGVVRLLYTHERMEQFIEGAPDADHNGEIHATNCQRELITRSELESAAHRRTRVVDEVETAILEPGGTICFVAKEPTPDVARHDAIMRRLEETVGT